MTTPLAHPGLASIRRILAGGPSEARCELCGSSVDAESHRHVVELEQREVRCACAPCHVLFSVPGAGGGRWRSVPDRWRALDGADPAWAALDIPVGLAFVVHDSRRDRAVASYPGPAGIAESVLPPEWWSDLRAAVVEVASMEPDVEAILLRTAPEGTEAYVVPVDACFELAGRLRGRWEGQAWGRPGGDEVDALFERVRARARRRTP